MYKIQLVIHSHALILQSAFNIQTLFHISFLKRVLLERQIWSSNVSRCVLEIPLLKHLGQDVAYISTKNVCI